MEVNSADPHLHYHISGSGSIWTIHTGFPKQVSVAQISLEVLGGKNPKSLVMMSEMDFETHHRKLQNRCRYPSTSELMPGLPVRTKVHRCISPSLKRVLCLLAPLIHFTWPLDYLEHQKQQDVYQNSCYIIFFGEWGARKKAGTGSVQTHFSKVFSTQLVESIHADPTDAEGDHTVKC